MRLRGIGNIENTYLRRVALVVAVILTAPIYLIIWTLEGILDGYEELKPIILSSWRTR